MLSFLHFQLEVISFLWLILTLGCFKSTRCTWFTQGSRLRYDWVDGYLNWPPSGRRWVCRVVELTWIRCGTDVDWGNCMWSSGLARGPCCRTKQSTKPQTRGALHLDTMTGTNSSNDKLKLRRNVEINSNWYFSYDVFSGMKSSTTWNRNAIAQSPRKMSELKRYFKYQWYTIFNGLSNDHRCNSSFIHHL